MKATELRIGNFIFLGKRVLKIEPNHISNLYYDKETEKLVSPIPLTEEWLLKFGFYDWIDVLDGSFNWKKGYVNLSVYEIIGFCFNYDDGNEYINIKYVHQLQNLYFALTGEELKIN